MYLAELTAATACARRSARRCWTIGGRCSTIRARSSRRSFAAPGPTSRCSKELAIGVRGMEDLTAALGGSHSASVPTSASWSRCSWSRSARRRPRDRACATGSATTSCASGSASSFPSRRACGPGFARATTTTPRWRRRSPSTWRRSSRTSAAAGCQGTGQGSDAGRTPGGAGPWTPARRGLAGQRGDRHGRHGTVAGHLGGRVQVDERAR